MPLLMCLADHDLQASSRFAACVSARAPHADIRHSPLGHFDLYTGQAFEHPAVHGVQRLDIARIVRGTVPMTG
ncbi:hypothetical protein [Actinophytocola sp. NPDC049390]|uniref:hypothetical protein n=1 Tax=Actinophytocola sp. NPDC049390 TaxID=3363894 RepID=UPI0037B96CB6